MNVRGYANRWKLILKIEVFGKCMRGEKTDISSGLG